MLQPIENNINLELLWEGVCAQDANMQRKFYNHTYKLFMQICARYAPSVEEAEQWVNDGFVKIFSNYEKYNNTGSLEGWLKRLVVNTCLDNLRQLKTQYNSVHLHTKETTAIPMDYSTTNEALLKMNSTQILSYIQQLPATQKTIFNMYAIEGFSHKEIAEHLGIKEANSQWHLNQARNFLKNKIDIQKKNYKVK
jgi:RNA polymerase sigma factor (sigma-70 family)